MNRVDLQISIVLIIASSLACDCSNVPGITDRMETIATASEADINIGLLADVHSAPEFGARCSQFNPAWCSVYAAFVCAIRDINARNDLLPNITLGFVALDTCTEAASALAVSTYFVPYNGNDVCGKDDITNVTADDFSKGTLLSHELKHYRVVGVVGPVSSTTSSLAASYLSVFEIPQLAIFATSDDLTDKTRYGYFLSMVSPDSVQIRAMLDLCKFFGWSYVSLVYSQGSYGENAATQVDHLLRKGQTVYNICLAAKIKLPSDSTPADLDFYARSLLAYPRARVVLLFFSNTHLLSFFPAVKRIIGVNRLTWLAGDFAYDYLNYPDLLDVAEGGIFINSESNSVPSVDRFMTTWNPWSDPDNVWLVERWEKVHNCTVSDPSNNTGVTGHTCLPANEHIDPRICPLFPMFTCRTYDAVHMIAEAIQRIINDSCPEASDEKLRLDECITGPRLLSYMNNVSYDGVTGKISFDADGNSVENLVFIQFQKDNDRYSASEIGSWSAADSSIFIDYASTKWIIGDDEKLLAANESIQSVCSVPCKESEYIIQGDVSCCWTCQPCRDDEVVNTNRTGCAPCPAFYWPDDNGKTCSPIEPTYLHFSHPVSVCLLTSAAVLGIACLAVISTYIVKRRHMLVGATCIPLSVIILSGTLVIVIEIVLLVVAASSNGICIARSFGFHCGIGLIYAPLSVRIVRLYRISVAGDNTIPFTSTRVQLVFAALLSALQVILTGISKAVSTSPASLRMPNIYDKYVELYCYKSTVWFLIQLVYNILLMLVCAVVGFVTRKLPENFNETWFIFASGSSALFAWAIFIPVYLTYYYAYMQPAILGFCLVVNSLVALGCQFAPIIYAVFFVPTEKINQTRRASVYTVQQATDG